MTQHAGHRLLRAEYQAARLAWLGAWGVLVVSVVVVVLWIGPAFDVRPRSGPAAAWIERVAVAASLAVIVLVGLLRRRWQQPASLRALAPGRPAGAALARASRVLSGLCLVPVALGIAGGLLTGSLDLTVITGLAAAVLLAWVRPRLEEWTTLEEAGSP